MPLKKGFANNPQEGAMLHVRIAEPVAVRRAVLNLALDSIQLVKRYDVLMSIRAKKQANRNKLNTIYREIRKLYGEIKLKDIPGREKPKFEPKPVMQKLPMVVVQKTDAEKKPIIKKIALSPLEQEMDEIRRKLASL